MSARLMEKFNPTRYTSRTNPSGTAIRYRYHRFISIKIRQGGIEVKMEPARKAPPVTIACMHCPPYRETRQSKTIPSKSCTESLLVPTITTSSQHPVCSFILCSHTIGLSARSHEMD